MSFRRHYGTGSYSSSLLTSPLSSSSYGSRGLGGYSSGGYSTPHGYTGTHNNYSGYSSHGSYGKSSPRTTPRTRSSSLPRDVRERSSPRYSTYSRGSSPTRTSISSAVAAATAVATATAAATAAASAARHGLTDSLADSKSKVGRNNSFTGGGYGRSTNYIRDYPSHYTAAKAIRVARSKSVGSNSSLSSGYGSLSASERGEAAKGSSSSVGSGFNSRASSRSSSIGPENGDLDYKRLYEEQLEENFRVHERLRGTENELRQARETIDLNTKKCNTRLAIADADKREKRALERKLSEMEEELKQLQKLKAENEKLKAENRALTRVVSKLTNSATAGMGSLSGLSK